MSGERVAKGVLIRAGEGYVLAVLPATSWIDWNALSRALNGVPVSLASEEEIARIFDDCEHGAVPPFGALYGLATIVESSLADGREMVCVGNLRHEGVRMRYDDYETLVTPIRAQFATTRTPSPRRPNRRRAG